jgi:hypothetical protein
VEKHPIYAESESAGKGVAPATMERVRAVVASARRVVRRLIVVGRGSGGFGSECENESESERVGGTVVVRQAGVYTKGRLKLGTRLFGQLVQYGYVVCVQSGGVPRVEQLVAGLKDFESSNLVMLYMYEWTSRRYISAMHYFNFIRIPASQQGSGPMHGLRQISKPHRRSHASCLIRISTPTVQTLPTTSFAGWSKPVQPGASDFQARRNATLGPGAFVGGEGLVQLALGQVRPQPEEGRMLHACMHASLG